MNALITGGSGYFGEVLIKELIKNNINCTSFDLYRNDNQNLDKKVKFFKGDIRNISDIKKSFDNIDLVFHCVAQVPLVKNKRLFEEVNIKGTENILDISLKNKVKKFIYISSSAVYGLPEKNPITRNSIPKPLEIYGKTKLLGEDHCRRFIEKGLNISIIRPRTILGLGRLGIFEILFSWIIEGSNIPVFDDGQNIYQFIHADDLANACFKASTKSKPDLFNIGTDKYSTMRNALENLCKYANTGSRVKSLNSKYIKFLMRYASKLNMSPLGDYHSLMYGQSIYFDISYEMKNLVWAPKYSNNHMFLESFNSYKKNLNLKNIDTNSSPHKSKAKQGILKLIKYFI